MTTNGSGCAKVNGNNNRSWPVRDLVERWGCFFNFLRRLLPLIVVFQTVQRSIAYSCEMSPFAFTCHWIVFLSKIFIWHMCDLQKYWHRYGNWMLLLKLSIGCDVFTEALTKLFFLLIAACPLPWTAANTGILSLSWPSSIQRGNLLLLKAMLTWLLILWASAVFSPRHLSNWAGYEGAMELRLGCWLWEAWTPACSGLPFAVPPLVFNFAPKIGGANQRNKDMRVCFLNPLANTQPSQKFIIHILSSKSFTSSGIQLIYVRTNGPQNCIRGHRYIIKFASITGFLDVPRNRKEEAYYTASHAENWV